MIKKIYVKPKLKRLGLVRKITREGWSGL